MSKRKLQLAITTVLISILTLVGCGSNHTNNTNSTSHTTKIDPINSKDVQSINRVGGLPLSCWKVLFASKDTSAINKIVTLVNTANKTDFDAEDYGSGKAIGYPICIAIKLQNNVEYQIIPLLKVTTQILKDGGTESSATPYKDRVELHVENGKKSSSYTLFSKQLANYVLEGANQDMPSVNGFSITPSIIKPGQTVTISGDGSTEKYIEIYIAESNSTSREKYLIAKVPTNFGAWKWQGTINGRTIKTLDGKEVKLTKDKYYFQTTIAGGGEIDLLGSK